MVYQALGFILTTAHSIKIASSIRPSAASSHYKPNREIKMNIWQNRLAAHIETPWCNTRWYHTLNNL
ncbi:hypothetical protein EPYR_00625 [Erwinia pyrifoliae DSM 12163]|nr:hypothetical protein EPYR_00625 [Erwinia pyrifoliae DSM 12163]